MFVTKDGEIVYSLPKTEKSECRLGEAERTQQSNPKSEIRNPKSTNSDSFNPKSAIQNVSLTKIGDQKSEARGVALKEQLIGGKIGEIKGGAQSVTTVSYFKGNDPSKWKSNISTYEVVDMGEVYKGIELRLKAYGDNVEKLFCVKPGADHEQIRISLSGIQPTETPMIEEKQPPESPFIKGGIQQNPP